MTKSDLHKCVSEIRALDARNECNLKYLEDDLVVHGSVLPFVGAGLSIPFGFPGWTQFLREEARHVRLESKIDELIADGKYEEAAELLCDRFGFREFEDALQNSFGEQKRRLLIDNGINAMASLPDLTSGPVITTNFDRALETVFIEKHWPFEDKVWGNSADLLTSAIRQDHHVLLKMHGDIGERRDRVLTLAEYQEHYGSGAEPDYSKPLPKLLRRLFESRPVLFLGCSLNHDRTLKVLKSSTMETNMHHYAIVEASQDLNLSDQRRRELSNFGIRAILYPYGRHNFVYGLLQHLAGLRAGKRKNDSSRAENGSVSEPSHRVNADECRWSHVVHEHFEEKLGYYLIRIRPYKREAASVGLAKLIRDNGLGTIRAYELFGTYDLMVQAWLPPLLVTKFESLLVSHLHCQGIQPFLASVVHKRWYTKLVPAEDPKIRRGLLAKLNRESAGEVESGLNSYLLRELQKNGLVYERPPAAEASTIKFFVSVNFEDDLGVSSRISVISQITEYLSVQTRLQRFDIDQGFGFGEILITAEAEDFYTIGSVPSWIAERFHSYGAITETYLSKNKEEIAGSGRLGAATFDALTGKDPYLADLIPELYPKRKTIHDDVEAYLKSADPTSFTSAESRFVRDFMIGVLAERRSDYQLVLMRLFTEWESFLREHHREFLGRRGLNVNDIYRQVNLTDKPWENFTLVDALQIYCKALTEFEEGDGIGKNWEPLTEVRNAAVHNRKELQEWRNMVRPTLAAWNRMRLLICLIEKTLAKRFDGLYAESCTES